MKIKMIKAVLIFIAAGILSFIWISPSAALGTQQTSGGTTYTIYGWLRNNAAIFTDRIDYRQDGNDLAAMRTWLRAYFDVAYSEKVTLWAAVQFAHEPWYDVETGSASERSGHEYSEWWNINDVLRECYINWMPSTNFGVKIGRQIVIWGEAMTSRVGDVVHPDDSRYAFGFANLDDARIPMWMIRASHFFPSLDLEFEWLVSPNLTGKEWRVGRSGSFATPTGTPGVYNPGQRFGIHPEDRPFGAPGRLVTPIERDTITYGAGIPNMISDYPQNSIDDLRYGFRGTSFIRNALVSFMYYHTQTYSPAIEVGPLTAVVPLFPGFSLAYRDYYMRYPDIDILGVSMNMDLPVGLVRAEATWTPEQPYPTDTTIAKGFDERDFIKYMLAWDLKFLPSWHNYSPFDVTLEHVGEWIPDNDNLLFAVYGTPMASYNPSFNMRIATDWINLWTTQVIFSINPRNKGGLFMPSVTFKPRWLNSAFSFELKYIRIFADSSYDGIGLLEQKDMLLLTTQFNF